MQANEAASATFTPPGKARRGRILVVDDEQRTRLVLCAALKAEGYEVEEARMGPKRSASFSMCVPI